MSSPDKDKLFKTLKEIDNILKSPIQKHERCKTIYDKIIETKNNIKFYKYLNSIKGTKHESWYYQ